MRHALSDLPVLDVAGVISGDESVARVTPGHGADGGGVGLSGASLQLCSSKGGTRAALYYAIFFGGGLFRVCKKVTMVRVETAGPLGGAPVHVWCYYTAELFLVFIFFVSYHRTFFCFAPGVVTMG